MKKRKMRKDIKNYIQHLEKNLNNPIVFKRLLLELNDPEKVLDRTNIESFINTVIKFFGDKLNVSSNNSSNNKIMASVFGAFLAILANNNFLDIYVKNDHFKGIDPYYFSRLKESIREKIDQIISKTNDDDLKCEYLKKFLDDPKYIIDSLNTIKKSEKRKEMLKLLTTRSSATLSNLLYHLRSLDEKSKREYLSYILDFEILLDIKILYASELSDVLDAKQCSDLLRQVEQSHVICPSELMVLAVKLLDKKNIKTLRSSMLKVVGDSNLSNNMEQLLELRKFRKTNNNLYKEFIDRYGADFISNTIVSGTISEIIIMSVTRSSVFHFGNYPYLCEEAMENDWSGVYEILSGNAIDNYTKNFIINSLFNHSHQLPQRIINLYSQYPDLLYGDYGEISFDTIKCYILKQTKINDISQITIKSSLTPLDKKEILMKQCDGLSEEQAIAIITQYPNTNIIELITFSRHGQSVEQHGASNDASISETTGAIDQSEIQSMVRGPLYQNPQIPNMTTDYAYAYCAAISQFTEAISSQNKMFENIVKLMSEREMQNLQMLLTFLGQTSGEVSQDTTETMPRQLETEKEIAQTIATLEQETSLDESELKEKIDSIYDHFKPNFGEKENDYQSLLKEIRKFIDSDNEYKSLNAADKNKILQEVMCRYIAEILDNIIISQTAQFEGTLLEFVKNHLNENSSSLYLDQERIEEYTQRVYEIMISRNEGNNFYQQYGSIDSRTVNIEEITAELIGSLSDDERITPAILSERITQSYRELSTEQQKEIIICVMTEYLSGCKKSMSLEAFEAVVTEMRDNCAPLEMDEIDDIVKGLGSLGLG